MCKENINHVLKMLILYLKKITQPFENVKRVKMSTIYLKHVNLIFRKC